MRILLSFCLLAIVLVGCAQHSASEQKTIAVGGAFALTGDAAEWGQDEQRAVELAFAETNAAGGIAGTPLVLVSEDTHTDAALTLSAVQKLISVNHVSAIIGPTWGDSYGALIGPVGEQAQVVQLMPSGTIEVAEYEQDYQYLYSTFFPQHVEIQTLVDFLVGRGATRAVVIRDPDPFNTIYGELFAQQAAVSGLTVAHTYEVPFTSPDYRTVLLKAKEDKPDVILVQIFAITDVGAILKQSRDLGIPAIVVASASGGTNDLLENYADYAENTFYFPYPKQNSATAAFEERYRAAYGALPNGPTAASAYDAATALIRALQSGARSGPQLKAALDQEQFAGVLGTISFDHRGMIGDVPYGIRTVHDGAFVDTP